MTVPEYMEVDPFSILAQGLLNLHDPAFPRVHPWVLRLSHRVGSYPGLDGGAL